MLSLLVVLFFGSFIALKIYDKECNFEGTCVTLGILTCIFLLLDFGCMFGLANAAGLDEQISVYETENTKIENDISIAVKSYKDYESSTFKDLDKIDPTVVVTMFPELKSDALVSKQIDVFVKNNDAIKKLKIEKAKLKTQRFMVYFG